MAHVSSVRLSHFCLVGLWLIILGNLGTYLYIVYGRLPPPGPGWSKTSLQGCQGNTILPACEKMAGKIDLYGLRLLSKYFLNLLMFSKPAVQL